MKKALLFCTDGKTTGSLQSKCEMQGQMISEKLSLDKYEVAWLLNALIYNLMYKSLIFEHQVYTKTFKCTYQLQLYPFDTQVRHYSQIDNDDDHTDAHCARCAQSI